MRQSGASPNRSACCPCGPDNRDRPRIARLAGSRATVAQVVYKSGIPARNVPLTPVLQRRGGFRIWAMQMKDSCVFQNACRIHLAACQNASKVNHQNTRNGARYVLHRFFR
jgi:hypothetical protein